MRFDERMSDADALMWRIEKDPLLRSTITSVVALDRDVDRARLATRLERVTRAVPRLRQRPVASPLSLAPPRWEPDPHFDLDYHLRFLRVPGGGGLDEVLELAVPIAMAGFDRARPLWEFHVVEDLAGGGAAVVIKLHHSITDGVGAIRIGMELFDLEPDAVPEDDPGLADAEAMPAPRGWFERLLSDAAHEQRRQLGITRRVPSTMGAALATIARDPGDAMATMARAGASAARLLRPAPRPASPVMRGRSLSVRLDALSFPLGELRAAARSVGGTLNDAFVAGVLGGMQRYHHAQGEVVESLRMTMPINVRGGDTEDLAGNAFVPARFMVPISIEDPAERMRAVHDLVGRQRAEPALAFVEPMATVINRLPTSAATAVFQSILRGIDLITSNVPGVPVPVFLAGARMVSQFAFGPLTGAAANVTLVSYCDQAHIGVNTDPAAVPDREKFIGCLRDGLDEVRKVA